MSKSKTIMAGKLCKVQQTLMAKEIESSKVEYLVPLIFKECVQEDMTFWFSFLEDCAILNLRDIAHENYELNIRYHYTSAPISAEKIDAIKIELLMNVFLITKEASVMDIYKEDEPAPETPKEQAISESKLVPPTSVRTVINLLEKNNIPVTKKNIESELHLDKMSSEKRRRCIAYLRSMEE